MKNKLFSIFTALAMVLGILVSPFTSAHAADEVTNSVTLHKMLIDKDNLDQFPKEAGQEGLDKSIYDGNALITRCVISHLGWFWLVFEHPLF